MPSSPAARTAAHHDTTDRLVAAMRGVVDPRAKRGVRHQLPVLLGVALSAVLAGARSFTAIGEWAAQCDLQLRGRLGLGDQVPDESTFRRVFARLDPSVLDQVLGVWAWTRSHDVEGQRVIAIDGKTVRGARRKDGGVPHLVAALDHLTGTVVGQTATEAKSNEIPAVRALLKGFDLNGVVVTVDAMHTQTDTAQAIIDGGGHYAVTVKGNQPTLHAACKKLPWADVPAHRATSTGHGRRATRTIKVVTAPSWIEFTGATQVAQVRRTVTRHGKKTIEVVYLITSADHQTAPPATLAAWVQGHWGIENRLHWVRDVTYDEDRSQIRTGHAPHVMATLRNTAIGLLRLTGWDNVAAAQRHHARHPENAINLLLTW